MAAGESLGEYGMRRLKEMQKPARSLEYTRRFQPDVSINDLVSIIYPKQNIGDVFRVQSQSIDLSYGASVKEEAINE